MPCLANFNESLKEIFKACWKYDPENRLSFNLLKELICQKSASIKEISLILPQSVEVTSGGSQAAEYNPEVNRVVQAMRNPYGDQAGEGVQRVFQWRNPYVTDEMAMEVINS